VNRHEFWQNEAKKINFFRRYGAITINTPIKPAGALSVTDLAATELEQPCSLFSA
jgi:hypothetical protein